MSNAYSEMIKRLYELQTSSVGKAMTLDTTHALNTAWGNPDQAYSTIHVAGTNGKGSVTTKISNALQAAGYRVGRYTSPHLSSFRERIVVNGHLISEEEITTLLEKGFQLCAQISHTPSFFEFTTCAALKHFADKKVDVVVLEVGLGGRLDSTNIVQPVLSVITSISLDHTNILGTTRETIAIEKGGIIKAGVPVIVGPQANLLCLQEIASNQNSPYIPVEGSYPIYDDENNAIAAKALEILSEKFPITAQALQSGLTTRPSCRMEFFQGGKLVLDVAHNSDGIRRLIASLSQLRPHESINVVCGFSKDKEVAECLRLLSTAFGHLYLVAAEHERAMPIQELVANAQQAGLNFTAHPSVAAGLAASLKQDGLTLVCGSFFIMSEARAAAGIPQEVDPIAITDAPMQRCV